MHGRPESWLDRGLAAQPSIENGLCGPLQRARAGAVTTRRPHMGRRGGALAGGEVLSEISRGAQGRSGQGEGKGAPER
jgi:hypothetical protein